MYPFNSHPQGALDRFAQFFISPLFTQSGTEREMKAVDSEFNMNWKVDGWRKHLVMKQLAKPDHKYASFQIGNLKTLEFEDTRDVLQYLDCFSCFWSFTNSGTHLTS
jgi:insulysin